MPQHTESGAVVSLLASGVVVCGLAAIVYGVALWSHAAAWVIGGVLVALPAGLVAYGEAREAARRSR